VGHTVHMGARAVTILGCTGSIGVQALDVIRRNPDRFRVVGVAAGGSDIAGLVATVLEFGVEVVGVARSSAVEDLQLALYAEADRRGYASGRFTLPRIIAGPNAAAEVAAWPTDVVLNALAGAAGLVPTLAALESGAVLALANKESLIVGGPVVQRAARPGQIVPVDSEHSALAQCLRGGSADEVLRLVLTASGGPFRGRSRADLAGVTAADALRHPTWSMGPLVTVNSATLVNKGLELIEAHLLFGVPIDRIDVVVHPQSVVHSLVEFVDGSSLAQASPPDMRIPIALGLAWPDRVPGAAPGCDWTAAARWDFEPLDETAFPAVRIARQAAGEGGTAPAVFNAANEVCVEAFLAGAAPFLSIVDTVERVLDEHRCSEGFVAATRNDLTVADVLAADEWARVRAREVVAGC
jgi:1-deoxy-D-xylulose-5-phosphate reductoisomerase